MEEERDARPEAFLCRRPVGTKRRDAWDSCISPRLLIFRMWSDNIYWYVTASEKMRVHAHCSAARWGGGGSSSSCDVVWRRKKLGHD